MYRSKVPCFLLTHPVYSKLCYDVTKTNFHDNKYIVMSASHGSKLFSPPMRLIGAGCCEKHAAAISTHSASVFGSCARNFSNVSFPLVRCHAQTTSYNLYASCPYLA